MRSGFSLLRKWFWKWRAIPPWHVEVRIVGGVDEDSGEILNPTVILSAGNFSFKVPDHAIIHPTEGTVNVLVPEHTSIDIHTENTYYEQKSFDGGEL